MMDLREGLQFAQRGDMHAAVVADLTEIVALEVGDHDQFGALFRRGQQLAGHGGIIATTRARSFDRTGENPSPVDTQEAFRRNAQNGRVAKLQKAGIRRGTDGAQTRIKKRGILRPWGRKRVGEIDLINIAGRDVFLRAVNKRDPLVFTQARAEFGPRGGRACGCRLARRRLPTRKITEPENPIVIEPSGQPSLRAASQRLFENTPVIPPAFENGVGLRGRNSPEIFAVKENARGGALRRNRGHRCDVSGKAVPFQGPPRYG